MAAPRNMLSGYAEPAHINDFMFEQQRRTFATYGKSLTVEFTSIFVIPGWTNYVGLNRTINRTLTSVNCFLSELIKWEEAFE